MAALADIPSEILLIVTSFLDVTDILSLRRASTTFLQFTKDRSIWLNSLRAKQLDLPLPTHLRAADKLSTQALESAVVSAYRTARAWSRPRRDAPMPFLPKSGELLLGLELFLDKWLLSLYSEGLVYLWDTGSPGVRDSAGRRCLSLDLGSVGWTSYVAELDDDHRNIILAMMRADGSTTAKIYLIPLGCDTSVFANGAIPQPIVITFPSSMTVRAINPSRHLVAFSRPSLIDVVYWDNHDQTSVVKKTTISTETEELEELWNGVIALHFVGPYILAFKTRSMELYPLPEPFSIEPHPLPILKYSFSYTTFREVSASRAVTLPSDRSTRIWSLSFFAYDVLQGLFYYCAEIRLPRLPSDNVVPSLEVTLAGIYPMANNIVYLTPKSKGRIPGRDADNAHSLRANNVGMRGFVSTHVLGPQGRRGVWVERRRGSMVRDVVVWSLSDPGAPEDGPGEATVKAIDGSVVYSVGSYDLREDITHCAFGEVSGLIVLGKRSGDVMLLELDS